MIIKPQTGRKIKTVKANILGCIVNLISMEQTLQVIEHLIDGGKPSQVITLNAEIIYQAQKDVELKKLINSASLVTPDGIGVIWAANRLGFNASERITGIDLLYKLCERAAVKGWKLYLLGAAPGVAEQAAEELKKLYPGINICGSHHGYFTRAEEPPLVENIKKLSPEIVFVALGAPRQEFWINQYKAMMEAPVSIGVGGSFDVIAGIKKRAPRFFITLNLEWLYRLVSEPSRIKRQLVLPKYVILIMREKLRKKNTRTRM
jgi:N-acetylglucosaminyldiphosphoundecaprenol N-acetyl-beta-D-mannosaminyltransferase